MSTELIKTGDIVMFEIAVGAAKIISPPTIPISGTGTDTVMFTKGCLEGDEKKVKLPVFYISPPYVIPGNALMTIKKLNKDQLSKKTKCDNKKIILKGSSFDTEMNVTVPAMKVNEATGVPEPSTTMKYSGKGNFITTNTAVTDG